MAAATANPHALHARVQKLLGSRAELEATKALLNTLVTSEVAPAAAADATHADAHSDGGKPTSPRTTTALVTLDARSSLSELRKNLRSSLEQKQLGLAESALGGLRDTLARISALKQNVDALDAKCGAIQSFLEATKRETQQVQAEAATLAAKKHKVHDELDEVKRFLATYQLGEDEIRGLYTNSLNDEDMAALFPLMERVQQVKTDCRALASTGDVHCALELLEAVGKYQDVGFERLYQWTTKKCAEVDGEPSAQLHRAIALLRDRPEFYNYCKESLTSSRRSLLVRRFIIALTRGGPNGIPRPIEMYAHDPVRYCGDMLAWVHQAIATESEFFRVLFDGDLDYTPSPHEMDASDHQASTLDSTNHGADHVSTAADGGKKDQDGGSGDGSAVQCTSMVGRAFEGVARPLQVRVEQTLSAQHGIVIAYKLVHLLAFYHHKFAVLVAHSGVSRALAHCRDASNRAFRQQFQQLVDGVAASAQDYDGNLAATHATMDVSHRLVALLEVFQSSLLPEHEKEADLSPLFEGVLPAVESMCERTVRALDPVDAHVFQINNLSCIRVPLRRFPEAATWYDGIGASIQTHLTALSEVQAKRLLDRYGVSSILHKIDALEAGDASTSVTPAQQPGLDGETISSVMEDFCTALMALAFPQLDHLTQPDLRDVARTLTVTTLAASYTRIYEFVHAPAHGYRTSHSTSGVLGGSHAILLHTPHQVRTVLEID